MTVADKILRAKTDYDEVYQAGISVSYDVGYRDGYDEGFKKGQNSVGLYDAEINNLLAVAPFFRKVSIPTDYYGNQNGFSGLLITSPGGWNIAVVLPFITEVEECVFDNMHDLECIIFTAKEPPAIGWQGLWSSDGGASPPSYMFVPDESIEAYKSATNLAEYADMMQPLSEYNNEGWYGG